MIKRLENTSLARPLFGQWEETLIWSCLEKVMGTVYVADQDRILSAAAVLGDFTFFAGKPDRELVFYRTFQESRDFMILVPQNREWETMIEACHGQRVRRTLRYATKKEKTIFSMDKLQKAADSLGLDFTILKIDEKLFEQCREDGWSKDLVSQFPDYETYQRLGIGVVAMKNGILVSGASSYSRYAKGIEIEVDTRQEWQRQGLAYACSARLILECLKQGLYPSWDAQNKASLALAEKLGYHFSHEYTAYELFY